MDCTEIELNVFAILWSVSGYEGLFQCFRVWISVRNTRSSPWKGLRRSDLASEMNFPTANLPCTCNITLQRCVKVLFHQGAERCWRPENVCRSVARWPPTVVHVIAPQDILVTPPIKWKHEEANLVSSPVARVRYLKSCEDPLKHHGLTKREKWTDSLWLSSSHQFGHFCDIIVNKGHVQPC